MDYFESSGIAEQFYTMAIFSGVFVRNESTQAEANSSKNAKTNADKSAIKKDEPLTEGTLKSGAQAEKISGSNIKHLNGAIGEA